MPTLEESMTSALKRRAQKSSLRNLSLPSTIQTSSGRIPIDFSSNDFLSLSTSPLLHNEYLSLLHTHLSPPSSQDGSPTSSSNSNPPTLGSTGSRLLTGNSPLALDLESQISQFHRSPYLGQGALLFNSGFDANSAFFACVPQKEDVVVYDEQIHASVHEVVEVVEENFGLGGVTEGGRGYVVVDEAHSTGVYGPEGRGLVCEVELEGKIFARLHTFGKALAGNGAIILTTPLVRHYLLNYARPLIYSTSLSTPSLHLIAASYSLLLSSATVPLQSHLQSLSLHFKSLLSLMPSSSYLKPQPQHLSPETENLNWTPIFSLETPEPRQLATYCQKAGYNVRPIMSPTVKKGSERVRVCLHSGNTIEELEGLVKCVRAWIELMEKRVQVSSGMEIGLQGHRSPVSGEAIGEGYGSGVGLSFKGRTATEKAKL
ncbi:hypothetical protein EYC84_000349 [Monilinia fructicola]|uniref:Aminotransferase class I/classII large domain-containing protein n=1 Tax=Monilinia fructicola TaxID=38448 RepID=A0A5M9JN99_MONFR|nr:hypothetical protein EYC84_000349 [Monilinia fructicola]